MMTSAKAGFCCFLLGTLTPKLEKQNVEIYFSDTVAYSAFQSFQIYLNTQIPVGYDEKRDIQLMRNPRDAF